MKNVERLLEFLLDAAAKGRRTILVTLTGVVGHGSRAAGSHMAVSEDGTYVGSLSAGCVERAIVGEALRIMGAGHVEQLRIGVGSPFLDLVLPCGGGMDLLFTPAADSTPFRDAHAMLRARKPVALHLAGDGTIRARQAQPASRCGWLGDAYVAVHEPALRIFAAGHGPEVLALAKLGIGYGAEMVVFSPDKTVLSDCSDQGAEVRLLQAGRPAPTLRCDAYSAVAILFHDPELELPILLQALDQDAFFIGAMGSRATHARRCRRLEQTGVPNAAIARIVAPIGLINAARDPETLALSTLAQIVACCGASKAAPEPSALRVEVARPPPA